MRDAVGEGFQLLVGLAQLAGTQGDAVLQRPVERVHPGFRLQPLGHVLGLHQPDHVLADAAGHRRIGQLGEARFAAIAMQPPGFTPDARFGRRLRRATVAIGVLEQGLEALAHQRAGVAADDRAEGRVRLHDATAAVQQHLADRRVLHRGAEPLLAAPVVLRQAKRDLLRARLGLREHPRDGVHQQAREQAQRQRRLQVGQPRRGLRQRGRFECQQPAAPVVFDLDLVPEGRLRIAVAGRRTGGVQHPPGLDVGDPEAHHVVDQRLLHEPLDPERHVDPAERRSLPRFRGGRPRAVAIDRHVQQQRDPRRVAVLHQLHRARQRRCAAHHRKLHRLVPGRFGIHVEADRLDVPGVFRLQVEDRPVVLARAFRPHAQHAPAGLAPLGLQVLQAVPAHVACEAEPDHAREALADPHPFGKPVPLAGRRPVDGSEQGRPAARHQFVIDEPLLEQLGGLLGAGHEARVGGAQLAIIGGTPQRQHRDQRGDQDHQRPQMATQRAQALAQRAWRVGTGQVVHGAQAYKAAGA